MDLGLRQRAAQQVLEGRQRVARIGEQDCEALARLPTK